jgi:hypothetical protein
MGVTVREISGMRRPAQADAAVRAVAAIGLLTVGIIHALEIRGQLSGAVWLVAGFWLLAVSAPACALWLLARPGPLPWISGGMICLSAGLGFVLTRTVGMPGDPGDVGNWLEPLGVASLITEAVVVILAAFVLADQVTLRPRLARAAVFSGSARSRTRSGPY